MSTRHKPLAKDELTRAFAGPDVPGFILSPIQLSALVGLSVKTIYEWIEKGRLDGAYRKRGKHVLIWRDRAVQILFNGTEWKK